jgi:hypothetical protein
MKSQMEIDRICNEIYLSNREYFDKTDTKVNNYIYINNGKAEFYPGIIPDIKIHQNIKSFLGIEDSKCDETFPKKSIISLFGGDL